VTLDSTRVPAWIVWILRSIRDHPDLALAVVALDGEPPRKRRTLFELYEALDRRLFAIEPDPLAPVDASAELTGVPRVAPGDVEGIRRHHADVVLQLGARPAEPAVADAARYGLWRYRHGRPTLFRELSAGVPATESVLEEIDREGERVIYRSTGACDPISLNRNRVPTYWKSARFAVRRLEDLATGRWEPGPPEPMARAPQQNGPTGAETVRHVVKVTGRVARRKLRTAALQHQWFLGFRRHDPDRMPHENPAPWRTVLPPTDRSYADPFVVHHGGETYVFLEELRHDSGRGALAVGRLDADGDLTGVEPILPAAHHTSYPYVFTDGQEIFLVPESGEAGRVDLFAATGFPTGWYHAATLIEGVNAVDATVHRHDGTYWMWVTIAVPGGRLYDETFLYFSDRLDSGWVPHPGNPVVSNARRARPAGRPFMHEGRLIRPSQDCAGRYGSRVVFNEVETLTRDEYRERPCGAIGPEWAGVPNLAAHTYTFDGEWEATDGLRTFPRWRNLSR
jgi:hypothetical protein